jgi:hypothetical protein
VYLHHLNMFLLKEVMSDGEKIVSELGKSFGDSDFVYLDSSSHFEGLISS